MIIGLLVLLSFQVITFSFAEQQKEAPSSPSTQNVPSQSFTFTIDQTTEGDFIVPTNGRDPRYQIPSYTYGVPYSWEIYVDNVLRGTFTGSSSGFYTA
ncbi:MAG: hypothetical protein LBG59_00730 [Candidatus Peribacteria bacterium]|jgi:hypothetical protein|nr:hypothetical protein [Candidatus Peribacteria bacterium]